MTVSKSDGAVKSHHVTSFDAQECCHPIMAPPRVQTETNSVPNVHFHVKLVTCSLVQKSVGVVPITNGPDHVTHHVILFDVDALMPHSTVLSIAKIQISLDLNVYSHAPEDAVLKVPNLEHVLSGKGSKMCCVGG